MQRSEGILRGQAMQNEPGNGAGQIGYGMGQEMQV